MKVALYPIQSLLFAYQAVREMLKGLKETGAIACDPQRICSFQELNELIGTGEAARLAEKYRIIQPNRPVRWWL